MAPRKKSSPGKQQALTKKQIEEFKKVLLDLKGQIARKLKGTVEEVQSHKNSAAYSQHQAENGTDDFEREIALELNHEEAGFLKKVERALEKIEEGTYGICDISGEPIPLARLRVMPYACMTVAAQEKWEKEGPGR